MARRALVIPLLTAGFLVGAVACAEPPKLPPLEKRIKWEVNEVPQELQVYFSGGLVVSFPIRFSNAVHCQKFHEGPRVFVFRTGSYEYGISKTPALWRRGKGQWRNWNERKN